MKMTDIEKIFVRKRPRLYRSTRVKNGIIFKKCHLSDIKPFLSLFAGKSNVLVLN